MRTVLAAARGFEGDLGIEPELLAARASGFGDAGFHRPIATVAELRDLFDRAGFIVDELQTVTVEGPTSGLVPAGARRGCYGQLVARKP
jgi:hypothetical protein